MSVRASMTLCNINHSFLYQARPDLMPYGFLSDLELMLWAEFFDNQEARMRRGVEPYGES